MNKKKLLEILITAVVSAGIAFLQSLLTQNAFNTDPTQVAGIAGALGGAIRSFRA